MFERSLVLPESKRGLFKEVLGTELPDSQLDSIKDETTYLTVGDVVSLVFRKHGLRPGLSIYDGFTERREMTEFATLVRDEEKDEVVNPAGMITTELVGAVRRGIEGKTGLIRVDGEEDLAVLPCMVLAPNGTKIVYGMPGRCMMVIVVDDDERDRAKRLLFEMEELEDENEHL